MGRSFAPVRAVMYRESGPVRRLPRHPGPDQIRTDEVRCGFDSRYARIPLFASPTGAGMSLSPAIIDAMVASGCTVEQLAAVMKASLAEGEARLADKRSKDAERQRRHRASRDVTVTECDNADSVTIPSLSPAPLSSPHTPQHTPRPHTHPETNTRARKGTRLSDDWVPAPLPADLAAEVACWPMGAVERELAKMRDWAKSAPDRSGVKKDWDATWRNWLRNCGEFGKNRNGKRTYPEKSTGNAASLALARLGPSGTASYG